MSPIQQLLTDHIDIWTATDAAKKSGRGRSSGNAENVYGISKLRELILEFAVRGKLVPQDPNDEPASELLKRIQAGKAKLIAEGKIKIDKPLPPIADNEKPFDLPKGWVWCRFGALVNICTGKLDANAAIENGQYPFFTCSQTPSKIDTYSFDTAAVLLAGNGDFNVKFYQGKFDAYQRTYVIEPVFFGLKFCYLLVLAQIETITKNNRGSAIPYLKIGDLTEPVFALPPLPEQYRIVAKVDELMALCDQLETKHSNAAEAHETLVSHLLATLTQSQSAADFGVNWQRIATHFDTLFTTEASIDALKQTLMQLAVMGKTVPQDPNDEPASELLKKIAAEKTRLVNDDGLRTTAAAAEHQKFDWVPAHWECERLGNLAKFIDYRGRTPTKVNAGVPLITAKNVRYGYIDREPREFVTPAEYKQWMTRGFPRIGDLLFTTEAPLGNAALVDIDEKFALAQRVICFQFHKPEISKFILLAFMSLNMQQEFQQEATGMTATGIKASKLKEIPVPLPPIGEQHRIVAKVDELMALCDQLKTRITQASQLQQKLADVLVEQAVA
jgi:type I restriction enzyme S subunit